MKSVIATFILMAFVTLGGFGMLAMAGMDGHHHEPGCSFMPGEQAICAMTALDHINAWQNAFTVTIPQLFVYLLLAVAVLFIWQHFHPPDLFVWRLSLWRSENYVSVPFYQELFSSGILNPKAP